MEFQKVPPSPVPGGAGASQGLAVGFGLLCPGFCCPPRWLWSRPFCLVHQALAPWGEGVEVPRSLGLELNKAEKHSPFLGAGTVLILQDGPLRSTSGFCHPVQVTKVQGFVGGGGDFVP